MSVAQSDISRTLCDWIQNILGADIPVDFGRLPLGVGSCMVRQVPTDPVVRRYVNGSGLYRYTYCVLLSEKTLNISEKGLCALDELDKIVRAISHKDTWPKADSFALASHSVDILPTQYTSEQDGVEVFYIQATLTYFKEGH